MRGISLEAATADDGDEDALALIAKYRAEYHVDLDGNDKLTVPTDPKTANVEYEFGDDKTIALSLPAKDDHKNMAEKSEGGVAFYDGDAYDMAVVATELGFSSYMIIHDETAPTSYEFDLTLPTGFKLSENEAGGVTILNADDGVQGIIVAPWAFDSDGEAVATQFKLKGDTLVQTVEHAGAAYPVIADPEIFGINIGVPLNRAEFVWCSRSASNAALCFLAYVPHRLAARARTTRFFGDADSTDDAGDAFRHCVWSARLTIDMGVRIAKGFGDRHELYSGTEEGALRSKAMDLTNNAHGRRAGVIAAGIVGARATVKYASAGATCLIWARDGTLQIAP